jgi:glyoxylase-like metal-dependent hydrolase (beta-lactamase superfamily II)
MNGYHLHTVRFDLCGGDVLSYVLETERMVLVIDTAVGGAMEMLDAAVEEAVGHTHKPLLVLNTHGHWDHVSLNEHLRQKYHALIAAPEASRQMMGDREFQFRALYGKFLSQMPYGEDIRTLYQQEFVSASAPDLCLSGGELLQDDGFRLRVLPTPGHSLDSVSFYEESTGYLFAGDAVQGNGFDGNAPFYCDAAAYLESLHSLRKLCVRSIFCGHGTFEGDAEAAAQLETSFATFQRIDDVLKRELEGTELCCQSLRQLSATLSQEFGWADSIHMMTTADAHLRRILGGR